MTTPTLLAIDPGLSCTGLVLLDGDGVIAAKTLRPPGNLAGRQKASWIVEEVANIMDAECPLVLAIEEGYVQPHGAGARPELPEGLAASLGIAQRDPSKRNEARSAGALKTAELRGRLVGLADGTDCEVIGVRPSQAQKALTGDGRSLPRELRKHRMVEWARRLYPVHRWTQDTADALGIGLAARRMEADKRLRGLVLDGTQDRASLPPLVPPSEPGGPEVGREAARTRRPRQTRKAGEREVIVRGEE